MVWERQALRMYGRRSGHSLPWAPYSTLWGYDGIPLALGNDEIVRRGRRNRRGQYPATRGSLRHEQAKEYVMLETPHTSREHGTTISLPDLYIPSRFSYSPLRQSR